MEGIAYVLDECLLLGHEVKLGIDITVNTFTGLTGNGDDGGISCLHFVIDANRTDTYLRIFLLTEVFHLIPFGWMTLGLELHLGKFYILEVDVGQRLRRLDSDVL